VSGNQISYQLRQQMTKYLLDNRLAPLTFSWGFVESPLPAVADFVRSWHQRNFRHVHTESVHATIEDALRKLEPLVEPRAELLLSTESGWTAYFGNGRRGGGASAAVGYICRELGCRGVAVSSIPNTLVNEKKDTKGIYGAVTFVLLAPDKREFLNYERAIAALNDGGSWAFRSTGELLPFEQVSRYSAKRIVDRLTSEMLEEYCASFGIRLFDPAFYGPSGTLIKILDRRPVSTFRPRSLEEVQQEMGPLPS
jgi:hypothetical protein